MSLFTKHNKMYCPKCAATLACMNGFILLSCDGWIVDYIINITECSCVLGEKATTKGSNPLRTLMRSQSIDCIDVQWSHLGFLTEHPRGGNGNPLQYSWMGNPMDRGAW